jgi:hypothetical protein
MEIEPELVCGGPRGGHQPLAEPCMGIVGCIKNGPKKATYEPWEGSAIGRHVETLRSVSEKKKNLGTHPSPCIRTDLTTLRWIPVMLQCTRLRKAQVH